MQGFLLCSAMIETILSDFSRFLTDQGSRGRKTPPDAQTLCVMRLASAVMVRTLMRSERIDLDKVEV